MRGSKTSVIIFLSLVALAVAFALVTSISTLAMTSAPVAERALGPQDITPTPAESDASQAGSTDAIVWMGILITTIIALPLISNRLFWKPQA